MAAMLRVRLPAGVPDAIRELVVGDQRRRNDICWGYSTSRRGDARCVPAVPLESHNAHANIGVNGAPAAPGGYVRAFNPERQSHQVIALAATGQLGMAAAGQIRLAVVRR